MAKNLNINQKCIAGPSLPIEDLELEEVVDIRTDDIKTYKKINKRSIPGPKEKAENDEHVIESLEEEKNKDETNALIAFDSENEIFITDETTKENFNNQCFPSENVCNDLERKNDDHDCNRKNSSEKNINVIENGCSFRCATETSEIFTTSTKVSETGGRSNPRRENGGGNNPRKDNGGDKKKKILKEVGLFALKTAVISGVAIGGTALIVPALGFGSLGVAGGSLAAAYQSSVLGGTIASGSAFATLQSIGMAGLSAAANTGIVAASAVASGVHSFFKNMKKKKK